MDELKKKIDSYVHLVYSVEELMKDTKKRHTDLIKKKFKSIVKSEIDILTSLEEINKDTKETKQRKLLLDRLRECYNEAHDKHEVLYADFIIALQQDHQNEFDPSISREQTANDETNETQTGLLRKFDISLDQEFDLEHIRKRQNEVKKIEETIDSTNHIFRTLHRLTHEQRESIDHIESNIDSTLLNINQGADHLKKAKEYHIAVMKKILPIAGAATAAAVTGPVGLIYGFKIGSGAAIALSGICGFVGGKVVANRLNHKAIRND